MTDYLKLENQLCFPVYALSRQITAIYRPYLDKLGLTYPQYLVMMVLWEDKTISVKELGEKLLLDSGTLTPLLKRMESSGLLKRSRSVIDERVVNIILLPKGLVLKKQAASIPEEIKKHLETDDEQLARLRDQLNRLLQTAIRCKQ